MARVSRSGYYAWASRPPSDRYVDDAYLTEVIRDIYQRSRSTYGAPRIHGQLCRIGTRVGRKRVACLMADAELVGVHSRRKWRRGRLDVAPAPDLLRRDFSAPAPNERWVADITEFMTGEGKLFLAGVRDLYGRGLVGWSMGTRQTSELVIEAVSMAVARRDPSGDLVHHSDKGCQGGFNWPSQHLDIGGDRWRQCGSGNERSNYIEGIFPHLEGRASHGVKTGSHSGRRSLAA